MTIAEQNRLDHTWRLFLESDSPFLKEDASFVLNGTKLRMKLKANINPTKQGIRIQFHVENEVDDATLETITVGLQKVLNKALTQYGMSVNEDPDVPRNEGQIIGYYLTVEQLENFIKKALKEALKTASVKSKPAPDEKKPSSEES
jgi:beta-lactam-binding protein with PASTA domain